MGVDIGAMDEAPVEYLAEDAAVDVAVDAAVDLAVLEGQPDA
jgi:hypothetical protein